MIWLIWRQSRLELLIGGIALALVSVWLIWTGLEMTSAYNDLGLPACIAAETPDETCRFAVDDFLRRFNTFQGFKIVPPLCLPFLIGLLLAAPTVLDFGQGVYRLAWTQGITRRRWLATKIGVGLTVSVVISIGLVAMWTWWRGLLDKINGRFDGGAFDFEGTVPSPTPFLHSLCAWRLAPFCGVPFLRWELDSSASLGPRTGCDRDTATLSRSKNGDLEPCRPCSSRG